MVAAVRAWGAKPRLARVRAGQYSVATIEGAMVQAVSSIARSRIPMSQEEFKVASEKEVEEKVISIVSEQLGVDKAEISRETSFVNDLNADSLDTVELIMELEDAFEMSIPDEEAEKIQTVGQAIEYILQHLNAKK
jgi:acyl carrier protein